MRTSATTLALSSFRCPFVYRAPRTDSIMSGPARPLAVELPVPAGGASRRRKRREISEDQKLEVKDAFDLFDTDKDKMLDYHELKVALRALGFDMKKADVLKILRDYDKDSTGKIAFEDFQDVATELIQGRNPHEELVKAFKLFDDDDTGKISLRNLRRVARELGETIPEEELRAMIEEFDTDGDGEISVEEFAAIMSGDT